MYRHIYIVGHNRLQNVPIDRCVAGDNTLGKLARVAIVCCDNSWGYCQSIGIAHHNTSWTVSIDGFCRLQWIMRVTYWYALSTTINRAQCPSMDIAGHYTVGATQALTTTKHYEPCPSMAFTDRDRLCVLSVDMRCPPQQIVHNVHRWPLPTTSYACQPMYTLWSWSFDRTGWTNSSPTMKHQRMSFFVVRLDWRWPLVVLLQTPGGRQRGHQYTTLHYKY